MLHFARFSLLLRVHTGDTTSHHRRACNNRNNTLAVASLTNAQRYRAEESKSLHHPEITSSDLNWRRANKRTSENGYETDSAAAAWHFTHTHTHSGILIHAHTTRQISNGKGVEREYWFETMESLQGVKDTDTLKSRRVLSDWVSCTVRRLNVLVSTGLVHEDHSLIRI